MMSLEIRYPEIAKKTSTPTKPPGNPARKGVEAHDEEDRDGPEPVDVRSVARGCIRGHGGYSSKARTAAQGDLLDRDDSTGYHFEHVVRGGSVAGGAAARRLGWCRGSSRKLPQELGDGRRVGQPVGRRLLAADDVDSTDLPPSSKTRLSAGRSAIPRGRVAEPKPAHRYR